MEEDREFIRFGSADDLSLAAAVDFLVRSGELAIRSSPAGWTFRLADPAGGEELLQLVQLTCPSTRREYFLPVPPKIGSCAQAVAWTFGLNRWSYHPTVET